MKLLSSCCQNQQAYNPRKEWDGKSRRTTNCKQCGESFDINENTIIHEEEVKKVEDKKQTGKRAPEKTKAIVTSISGSTPVFKDDEIDFTKQAYIKAIEAGQYSLLSGWVQFLDKTGKLADFRTNKEELLDETFKFMTPRELVMEAIGLQNAVDLSERKQLRNTLREQDSQTP